MLGIAITTFNRAEQLSRTLDFVRNHTSQTHHLVVVDDGSDDATPAFLKTADVDYILGGHRGVAWNKNRALYYLNVIKKCDVIILLEDDTYPTQSGWEAPWITAAQRYKHVNFAPQGWGPESFLSGNGTPENPFISKLLTGQCSAFCAEILNFVGYLDSRFQGYGYEHAEHTQRIIESGYGGHVTWENSEARHYPFLIKSPLKIVCQTDPARAADVAQSAAIWARFQHDQAWRAPWRSDAERAVFYAEMMASRDCKAAPYSLAPLRDWILVTDRDLFLTYDHQTGQIMTANRQSADSVTVRSDGRDCNFILQTEAGEYVLVPKQGEALRFELCPADATHAHLQIKRGKHDTFSLWHGAERLVYRIDPNAALGTRKGPDALHTFVFLRYATQGPNENP